MRKLAYLECPTGLAGDMCLGALIELGVPLAYLTEMLGRLGLADEYELQPEQVTHNGFVGTKMHVRLTSPAAQRHEDASLIAEGELPAPPAAMRADHSGPGDRPPLSPSQDHGHAHPHPHPHDQESAHSHPHHEHSDSHASEDHQHERVRRLPDIEALIRGAHLPDRVTDWSLAIFRQLAIAEAAVHGATTPETVHFHEVGATDAIVDIVGTCLGLDWLQIDALYCAPMPTGGGVLRAAHGLLPIPTPAVLKLWELHHVPIYSNGIQRELVTPTGAAIAVTLATAFGEPPPMTLQAVGLGAGSRQLPIPNMVRLWIGTSSDRPAVSPNVPKNSPPNISPNSPPNVLSPQPRPPATPGDRPPDRPGQETVCVLEAQVDDLNPQAIGYLYDQLLAGGALDVFTQAVSMKKSRPGVLITVICSPDHQVACEAIVFAETTTLGIRHRWQQRTILDRSFVTVTTVYGQVQVKLAHHPGTGALLNVQPEFEDCARLAQQQGVPWRTVQQAALHQWHQQTAIAGT